MTTAEMKPFSLSKRQYLSEKVATVIRDRIYSLEFKPGERLIVETLAQEMDVSMTPIREGLKELVAQGLVTYDGKSYSIMSPTKEEVINLHEIRNHLEQLSAYLAAEHMNSKTAKMLISQFKKFAESNSINDGTKLIQMDQHFHRSITENSDNARLKSMLETVQDQCWLIRHWGFAEFYDRHTAKETIKEHIEILEAIIAKDPEKAEGLMREHMKNTGVRELDHLKFLESPLS